MESHLRVSGSPLSTQKTYLRALRDLMENTGDIPENLSVERIKKHLSDLRGNLSSSALNIRVCGIKYYFRNVEKRPDLVVDIPNPLVAKYIQEVLTINELDVLFSACNDMRELALLHLLYDCGLR
jgi:integrase/recombinase XerD